MATLTEAHHFQSRRHRARRRTLQWAAAQPPPRRFLLETHLVVRIFALLPPRDLVACMCVNTAFYTFAVRALHRRLVLRELGPWPEFCDAPPPVPPKNEYAEFGTLSGFAAGDSIKANTATHTATLSRRPRVLIPSQSMPTGSPTASPFSRSVDPLLHRSWLAKYVRELDIYPHPITKCTDFPPMDNVEVVRIRLHMYKTPTGHVWMFHTDAAATGEAPTPRVRRPSLDVFPECRALAHLRPQRVVVLGAPAIYSAIPVTCLPYTLLAAANTYTLVLGPDPDLVTCGRSSDLPRRRARGIMADIHAAASANKVTVIFWTTGPGATWTTGYRSRPSTEFRDSWVARLFNDLADMLLHMPLHRTVTFVNTGAIDYESVNLFHEGEGRVQRRIEGFFRAEMTRFCVESLGLGHAGATAQGDRFHFVSMEAYVASGEWVGQVDAEAVAPWARVSA
ncbi:PAB1 binding protein [Vanrija albida]|uniref:PAB1 binding protein n=1 Tax=Vanrija albida TaxID=181172 RepID=A0ABR3PV52_9TREE